MAGFLSEYLSHALLDHVWSATTYTPPAPLYVGLYTVAPTASGGGTEVTGGSYARVAMTNNVTNFAAAASQIKRNTTAITFPAPTANWGTVIGAGYFDASTGGNMLAYGPFGTSRNVLNGDSAPVIQANGGTITLE